MIENIKVAQLEDMQHAIGYKTNEVYEKRFTALRNYFVTGERHEEWDDLVGNGLAERAPYPRAAGNDPQIYRVSAKGIECLEKILHIKIVMEV